MALFSDEMRELVLERLKGLAGPVDIIFFKKDPEVEALIKETGALSDNVRVQVFDPALDSAVAAVYGVDQAPAIVLEGPAGSRVRFYGMPDQQAFFLLLESLLDSAQGKAEVGAVVKRRLAGRLRRPVRVQVFVSPECPFSMMTARTAHRFAIEYPQVTATMVEAAAFPELVERYRVFGLPKTVVNGRTTFQGAMSESVLADALLQEMSYPPGVVHAIDDEEIAFEP